MISSLLPALQLYIHRLCLQMTSPAQNGGTQFNGWSAIFCNLATHPPAFSKSISSLLLILKRIMWFSRSMDEIQNICWRCWLKMHFFGGINLTHSCSSPFVPSDKSRVPHKSTPPFEQQRSERLPSTLWVLTDWRMISLSLFTLWLS